MWDFSKWSYDDLMEVDTLFHKLGEFDLQYGLDPEGLKELRNEIKKRRQDAEKMICCEGMQTAFEHQFVVIKDGDFLINRGEKPLKAGVANR